MMMKKTTNVMRFQRPPPPIRRHFPPSKILTDLNHLRTNNPELYQSEMAKLKKKMSSSRERIIEDPETRKNRLLAERKIAGPFRIVTQPQTVRSTKEATCYTKYEVYVYKDLANIDPRLQVFEVLNPKNGEADEEYTACVIKRFREDPLDSSVTAMATSGTCAGAQAPP
ncbi:uncharacterized protein [Rutidosis leptorrhynchoides]|uniref:uncharacterized protein n=1 Tax=Rutidosis leptorrhynchoides TaxID=125765 RepID=UPI003A99852E